MRSLRTDSRVQPACFSKPSLCVDKHWFQRQTNGEAEVATPYERCRTDSSSLVVRPASARLLRADLRDEACVSARRAHIAARLGIPGAIFAMTRRNRGTEAGTCVNAQTRIRASAAMALFEIDVTADEFAQEVQDERPWRMEGAVARGHCANCARLTCSTLISASCWKRNEHTSSFFSAEYGIACGWCLKALN